MYQFSPSFCAALVMEHRGRGSIIGSVLRVHATPSNTNRGIANAHRKSVEGCYESTHLGRLEFIRVDTIHAETQYCDEGQMCATCKFEGGGSCPTCNVEHPLKPVLNCNQVENSSHNYCGAKSAHFTCSCKKMALNAFSEDELAYDEGAPESWA